MPILTIVRGLKALTSLVLACLLLSLLGRHPVFAIDDPWDALTQKGCAKKFSQLIDRAELKAVAVDSISGPHDQCQNPTCWIHPSVKDAEYRIRASTGHSVPLDFQYIYAAHLLDEFLKRIDRPSQFYGTIFQRAELKGGTQKDFDDLVLKYGLLPEEALPRRAKINWARLTRKGNRVLSKVYADYRREYEGPANRYWSDVSPDRTQKAREALVRVFRSELGPMASFLESSLPDIRVSHWRDRLPRWAGGIERSASITIQDKTFASPKDFANRTLSDQDWMLANIYILKGSDADLPTWDLTSWHLRLPHVLRLLERFLKNKQGVVASVVAGELDAKKFLHRAGKHRGQSSHSLLLVGIHPQEDDVVLEFENSWKDASRVFVSLRDDSDVISGFEVRLSPELLSELKKTRERPQE